MKTSPGGKQKNLFHVVDKVRAGDDHYVRAKHAQLVEKNPEATIVLFWKAINAGDRVDSALKDMTLVMKQLDRPEEAIEAIKSFRGLYPKQTQESLDNLLIDLYKGNLGWAYIQKTNYLAAEVVFRKAQMIYPDANKACNLGLCLIKQARHQEARSVLEQVLQGKLPGAGDVKSRNRAKDLWRILESWQTPPLSSNPPGLGLEDDDFAAGLERLINKWAPNRSRRLPIFEEISEFRDQLDC